jgi:peptidoglycan/LPS O-acetylase OafA/YrhL
MEALIRNNQTVYFNNLDAMRGAAALAVVMYHIALWIPAPVTYACTELKMVLSFAGSGGLYGVHFFFVLSGFLISYRLFEEKQINGKIQPLHFYVRRILRIWPLYYVTIIIGFYMTSGNSDFSHLFYYLFFAANMDLMQHPTPENPLLGVHWSVAAEEQFYLLWPLLFILIQSPRMMAGIFMVLIFASEVFFQTQLVWEMGYYHPLCALRFLATGGLLAWMCFFHQKKVEYAFQLLPKGFIIFLYALFPCLLYFRGSITETFPFLTWFLTLLPLFFFCFVIAEQHMNPKKAFAFGQVNWLNKSGKISYGMYLLHMPAIQICMYLFPVVSSIGFVYAAVCSLVLTYFFSLISYLFLEKPFLSLKEKYFGMRIPTPVDGSLIK